MKPAEVAGGIAAIKQPQFAADTALEAVQAETGGAASAVAVVYPDHYAALFREYSDPPSALEKADAPTLRRYLDQAEDGEDTYATEVLKDALSRLYAQNPASTENASPPAPRS